MITDFDVIIGWMCFLGPIILWFIEFLIHLCASGDKVVYRSDITVVGYGEVDRDSIPINNTKVPPTSAHNLDTRTEAEKAVFGDSLLHAAGEGGLIPTGD